MAKRKTLLTPENQWDKTVAYLSTLGCKVVSNGLRSLFVFRGTHRLARDGDAFLLTRSNGMVRRYGVTGVTSKGARLQDYYLPLGPNYEYAWLPDDFIGIQWNDPDIRRYVADLRASLRSRVSAYSPAPSHCKTSSGIDTEEINCQRGIVAILVYVNDIIVT